MTSTVAKVNEVQQFAERNIPQPLSESNSYYAAHPLPPQTACARDLLERSERGNFCRSLLTGRSPPLIVRALGQPCADGFCAKDSASTWSDIGMKPVIEQNL